MNKQDLENLKKAVSEIKTRSAWAKGVKEYAEDLLYKLTENAEYCPEILPEISNTGLLEKELLNGAKDWHDYSWGGCSHIYDIEIVNNLCTPSEKKRAFYKDGSLKQYANNHEQWLDVQARALYQACELIKRLAKF